MKRNRTSLAMNVANHLVNHIIFVAFLELKKIVFSKKNSKIYILKPFFNTVFRSASGDADLKILP